MGGYIGISFDNILQNGSLHTSTSGWTISSGNTATIDSDGCVKITLKQTGTGTYANYQAFSPISGPTLETRHVLYVCAKAKSLPTNASYPRLYLSLYANGGTSVTYSGLKELTGLSETELNDGEWHIFASRPTTYNQNTGESFEYFRMAFGENVATAGDVLYFKDIGIYDLTSLFGAGQEPTNDWCREHLAVLYGQTLARKICSAYVGISGVAHKVKKAYVGVDGLARLVYSAESHVYPIGQEWVITDNSITQWECEETGYYNLEIHGGGGGGGEYSVSGLTKYMGGGGGGSGGTASNVYLTKGTIYSIKIGTGGSTGSSGGSSGGSSYIIVGETTYQADGGYGGSGRKTSVSGGSPGAVTNLTQIASSGESSAWYGGGSGGGTYGSTYGHGGSGGTQSTSSSSGSSGAIVLTLVSY